MLDLDAKYVAILRQIFATHIPFATVWVYGSRIKGSSHAGSDIDLVVLPSENITPNQFLATRAALTESNVPILIDLLEWESIPDNFKVEIESKHEVFYDPSMKLMP